MFQLANLVCFNNIFIHIAYSRVLCTRSSYWNSVVL